MCVCQTHRSGGGDSDKRDRLETRNEKQNKEELELKKRDLLLARYCNVLLITNLLASLSKIFLSIVVVFCVRLPYR